MLSTTLSAVQDHATEHETECSVEFLSGGNQKQRNIVRYVYVLL